MAKKKKRKPGKNNPTKLPPLPDPRVMEGVMRQFAAGFEGHPHDDTPLGKAQAILDRAFGEPNVSQRIRLAQEALAICPDAADAYNLLAEHQPAISRSRNAIKQGESACPTS